MDKRISLGWAGYGNLQAVPGVTQLALLAWMVVVAGAFQNVPVAAQAVPSAANVGSPEAAEQTPESTTSTATGQQSTAGTSSGKEAAKQGTDQFRLSRERYEKAVAYSRAGYTLHFVSVAWGMVVRVALLKMGVVGRLRDFAEAKSRKRFGQALIFVPGLFVLLAVLKLPIGMYWLRLSLK